MIKPDGESLRLSAEVVQQLIPHRTPLIMVDGVDAFRRAPRPALWAHRGISATEDAFAGHFPGIPLWPGIYTIEGLGQTSLLLSAVLRLIADAELRGDDAEVALAELRRRDASAPPSARLMGVSGHVDVKLLAPVHPGCTLHYRAELTHTLDAVARFDVEATVDGVPVARGTMTGAIGEDGETVIGETGNGRRATVAGCRFLSAFIVALALSACAPSVLWSGHTPDRAHRIEVIRHAGLQFVVIDGERAAGYKAIAAWSIALSDDGRHVAYAARRGNGWVVVTDGRAGETWDGVGAIELGPDGRVAVAVERAGGWHVVVDGAVGPRFDAIVKDTIRWSPSGDHVVYVGSTAAGVQVVANGVAGPVHDGVGQLAIDDAGRVAYAARRRADAFAIVDGTSSRAWRAISQLQLGPGRAAYAGFDGDAWRVVVDGTASAGATSIRALGFRADGAHVAWLARVDQLDVVVLDERPVAAAAGIRPETVVFSSAATDAPGLAWVEPTATGGERVVVDGTAHATFDQVGRPRWSPDGRRLAYTARRDDTWSIVLDGAIHAAGTWASDPVWSPDSRRIGHVERTGKRWTVAVDGDRRTFDLVFHDTLSFSRNSRTWAVIAGDLAREQLFFAIDGATLIPLAVNEIYSAAAAADHTDDLVTRPADDSLARWTRAEADRASVTAPARPQPEASRPRARSSPSTADSTPRSPRR